jgi:hypothetical protein
MKFHINEYILEGLRKVVDVIINDEPDDVSKFLPEKKADYIRLIIAKAAELNQTGNGSSQSKDCQTQYAKFIEKIFE